MEDFAETLEECLVAEVTHREYLELRSAFFLTATRYGGKIFPRIVNFVDDVGVVINFLASLNDEQSMIRQMGDQISKCEKHKRNGEELEEMHNFVAAKLMNMRGECLKMGKDISGERSELLDEASKLNRPKL